MERGKGNFTKPKIILCLRLTYLIISMEKLYTNSP